MMRLARDVGPPAREQELARLPRLLPLRRRDGAASRWALSAVARRPGSCSRCWSRGGPNLLLLDEPTNHLDLTTREALSYGAQRVRRHGHAGEPRSAHCCARCATSSGSSPAAACKPTTATSTTTRGGCSTPRGRWPVRSAPRGIRAGSALTGASKRRTASSTHKDGKSWPIKPSPCALGLQPQLEQRLAALSARAREGRGRIDAAGHRCTQARRPWERRPQANRQRGGSDRGPVARVGRRRSTH